MAKVEKIETVVQYTLTLSTSEAQEVINVLSRVGGHPDTKRKYINAVFAALHDAGLRFIDNHDKTMTGSITYK
jgi:hypothetical protein